MKYLSRNLGEREHLELMLKGYLKLKMEVPTGNLQEFNSTYQSGKEITFDYEGKAVTTTITSIDVAKEGTDNSCKVFVGFALQ